LDAFDGIEVHAQGGVLPLVGRHMRAMTRSAPTGQNGCTGVGVGGGVVRGTFAPFDEARYAGSTVEPITGIRGPTGNVRRPTGKHYCRKDSV
jgi:hypothetical protein